MIPDYDSNQKLAVRMMDLQTKWLRNSSTVEKVHEVVGIEQFLNTLKPKKRLLDTPHGIALRRMHFIVEIKRNQKYTGVD